MFNFKQEIKTLKFWSLATFYLETFLLFHLPKSYQTIEYSLRENDFFQGKTEDELKLTYSYLYSMIQVLMFSLGAVNGLIIDRYGTWYSRFVSQILMCFGLIFAISTTPETSSLVFLSLPLFYGGGYMAVEIGCLSWVVYPKNIGVLSAFIGIAINASQVWYIYYKQHATPFEDTKYFWYLMLSFQPLMLARTVLMCPKLKVTETIDRMGWKTRHDTYDNFYESLVEEREEINHIEVTSFNTTHSGNGFQAREVGQEKAPNSFFKEIKKPSYILLATWWLISDVRMIEYYSLFQPWLRSKTENDILISHFTQLFTKITIFQSITEPICGQILDYLNHYWTKKYHFNDKKSMILTSMLGLIFCSITTCLVSLFQSIPGSNSSEMTLTFAIKSAGLSAILTDSVRWTCRYYFLFKTVDPEYFPRVMANCNLITLVANLIVPNLHFVNGNLNLFHKIFSGFSFSTVVIPLLILKIQFRK